MPQLTAESLLNLGFRDIARWGPADNGRSIAYVLDGTNPMADRALLEINSALYAFVQDDAVHYIGKTARSIRKRFVGYCNPGSTQRTNLRCHGNIRALLRDNVSIRIFVFTPISDLRYGPFQIDLAAALEESLILSFSPPWNGREGKRPVTEEAEREAIEESQGPSSGAVAGREFRDTPVAAPTSQTETTPMECGRTFQIKLESAYYDQGLINPGAEASNQLGAHGDPVIVSLGEESERVDSMINRTANANGAVRVVGNNRLIANWFQKHFSLGDVVNAIVQDAHHIRLLLRS